MSKVKRLASSHEKRGALIPRTRPISSTLLHLRVTVDSATTSVVYFYNHHKAHALPTLFYTDWDDALMVTSDGGGDNVNHSRRRFANGQIDEIYGGDKWPDAGSTNRQPGTSLYGRDARTRIS